LTRTLPNDQQSAPSGTVFWGQAGREPPSLQPTDESATTEAKRVKQAKR
jgi:hypothetical protein